MPAYAWAGIAVTGALAVTTGVLGLVALDRRSTYQAANVDPSRVADRQHLRDDAAAAERNATVASIATALAGGITVVLVLTRPRAPVTVGARPNGVDLAVHF
jgi:hypothetical protein